MKNKNIYTIILLILLPLISPILMSVNTKSSANASSNSNYTLIYVDNSHSSINSGLSSDLIQYLFDVADTVKSSPFMLYLSNGVNPVYTKNSSQLIDYLGKLYDNYSNFPDAKSDKNSLLKLLGNEDFSKIKTFKLYLVLTESYLEENIKEKPGYLFKLMPKEILELGKDSKLIVNICYSPNSKSSMNLTNSQLEDHLNFYNTGKYKSNISYKVIKK